MDGALSTDSVRQVVHQECALKMAGALLSSFSLGIEALGVRGSSQAQEVQRSGQECQAGATGCPGWAAHRVSSPASWDDCSWMRWGLTLLHSRQHHDVQLQPPLKSLLMGVYHGSWLTI